MAGRYAASELIDAKPEQHIGRHADLKPSGRRRAPVEVPLRDPANTGPLHRAERKRSGVAAAIVTTGTLTLAAGAAASVEPQTEMIQVVERPQEEITADSTVVIAQPKVTVTTEPAPPPPPVPAPKVEYAPPPPPPPPAPTPVVVVPPQPVVPPAIQGEGQRQVIVSAALGQLGVWQDCTKLVTNSLYAAGINFHGWPREYLSLGYVVHPSQALPGDLIYYNNGGSPGPSGLWDHIAVYIGNGQAVHGGWNGNQTVVFSTNVNGAGPNFIRVA